MMSEIHRLPLPLLVTVLAITFLCLLEMLTRCCKADVYVIMLSVYVFRSVGHWHRNSVPGIRVGCIFNVSINILLFIHFESCFAFLTLRIHVLMTYFNRNRSVVRCRQLKLMWIHMPDVFTTLVTIPKLAAITMISSIHVGFLLVQPLHVSP